AILSTIPVRISPMLVTFFVFACVPGGALHQLTPRPLRTVGSAGLGADEAIRGAEPAAGRKPSQPQGHGSARLLWARAARRAARLGAGAARFGSAARGIPHQAASVDDARPGVDVARGLARRGDVDPERVAGAGTAHVHVDELVVGVEAAAHVVELLA